MTALLKNENNIVPFVKGNKMVDMQLSNEKLVERGVRMIMSETQLEYNAAKTLLEEHGSVRIAVDTFFGR